MFLLDTTFISLGWYQAIAFGFGIIIGSFLNVYIYRFHTGKSLAGHSHCLSCGTGLVWFELFPLVSYLALRGRCRTCGSLIPARYFLVELLTGALFALCLTVSLDVVMILLLWYICSLLVIITVYDLYHFIIPDLLTGILTLVVVVLQVYEVIVDGQGFTRLLVSAGTAFGASVFFLLLWILTKGRGLGFGDVKLAFPLALLVGPAYTFSFVVFSFWIGAVVSLAIMGWARLRRGKTPLRFGTKPLTMKSAVPFAPFLIAGCLLVLFTHYNVLDLFTF